MGFWSGINKMIEGLNEVAESPTEIAGNIRAWRRERLSGKYVVTIEKFGSHPTNMVAHITYFGTSNTRDIDHVAYEGQTSDIWDDITQGDRNYVSAEIQDFLNDMQIKKGAYR